MFSVKTCGVLSLSMVMQHLCAQGSTRNDYIGLRLRPGYSQVKDLMEAHIYFGKFLNMKEKIPS